MQAFTQQDICIWKYSFTTWESRTRWFSQMLEDIKGGGLWEGRRDWRHFAYQHIWNGNNVRRRK